MKQYVLGVDGGGTKSHLAIFGDDAVKADFRTWGTLNHECMQGSFAELEQNLRRLLHGALQENGIGMEQIAYSVFGLAGVDTKKQHQVISEILERLGFSRFTLCNDAYLGIPAGSPDGTGICAINGTGCTVAGKDASGKAMQIGGVGDISEDLGGAAYMGKTAVGRVYRALFRQGEPTAMTDILFNMIGVTSKYDFLEVFTDKLEQRIFKFSRFNRLLFEAEALGDKVAREVLAAIAANYAGAIGCMFGELDLPDDRETRIVFAGSVFAQEKNPVLRDGIKRLVEDGNPHKKIKYVRLEKPPVAGAVVEALNRIECGSAVCEVYGQF